jgi:hypothetical protein
VLVQRLEPSERSLVQEEGEVEALGVVVAASILDGEGVAPEPLDSQRLEFSGRRRLRSRTEKERKPSLSPDVEAFLRRSSSIFWRVS